MHGSRIFGLDLMRAAAILLVVFDHNADVLGWFIPGVPAGTGNDGVDLFFVLSGYLIGGILLKYAALDGVPWWRRALDFWQRRWLRTLPNYYLFLALNVVLVGSGLANGLLNHNAWAYAFFLQNIWKSLGLFFWESWSLAIEEWFYLLFPIILFSGLACMRVAVRTGYLAVVLILIALPTAVRISMVPQAASVFDLELGARHLVISRLDTIGFGMLAAWMRTGWALQWRRLRGGAFLLGLVALVVNARSYGNDALYYSATFFFTTNAVSMVLLLPLLSTWEKVPRGGSIIVFLSTVSYALYLVHLPVRSLYGHLYEEQHPLVGVSLLAAYVVLCIAVSWLVYRFWERRFMAWREPLSRKLIPSS